MSSVRQNWLYWHKAIEVEPILDIGEGLSLNEATTFGGENLEYRRSKVGWLTGNDLINDIMRPFIQEASSVMGVKVYDQTEIQYTEYHGTNEGKYDWHHDVDWNNSDNLDRKLSVTIQLSDADEYEGGTFEFKEVENPSLQFKDKGTILIFPSYLVHRVLPVTSGVRKTLVAWVSGPRWQ